MFYKSTAKTILSAFTLVFCSAALSQEYSVCKSLTDGGQLLDRYNVEQISDVQHKDFLDFCSSKSNRVERARKKSAAWKSAAQYTSQIKGFGNLDLSSDDPTTSSILDRICLTGASEFRQYFRTDTASISGEFVTRYFTECINILANSQVDAIGGEVWADPDISTRFHAKITRSVRSPTTDYVFDAASRGTTCIALGERQGAPDNTARQLKSELGLTCDAPAPSRGILTGQLSFRAYDPTRNILIGGAKVLRYTVTSYPFEKQISDSVENRLQAQTAPLKAEIDAMKTQIAASRSTFRLRAGAPSAVPGQSWASCQAGETLVSGSCIGQVEHVDKDKAVGAGQIAIGPYLMNANKTWPGEEPIHTVECRAAATPVRAFAVCMKIE